MNQRLPAADAPINAEFSSMAGMERSHTMGERNLGGRKRRNTHADALCD